MKRGMAAARGPRALAIAQGAYFLVTGVWPLVSIRTFEAVTGPKRDDWLVKTVGLLVAAAGAVLVGSGIARRGRMPPEVRLLAAGQALALGGVSLHYALKGTISRVYLADAAAEALLAAGWWVGGGIERLGPDPVS